MIQAFVNAFDDALAWLASADDAQIADRSAPFFPDLPVDLLRDSISQYRANNTWPRNSLITPESFNAMRDILIDGGLVRERHSYERLVRPEFALESQRRSS